MLRALLSTGMAAWIGLAVLPGCNGPVPPHAAMMLVEARQAYLDGDDVTVVVETDRFLREFCKRQEACEAYYLRGLARQRAGDLEEAATDLTQAAQMTRRADLAGRTEMALGMVAESRGDDAAATDHYRRSLAALGETASPSQEVLFRLACCLQRLGQWRAADLQFEKLLYGFPDSPHTAQARLRVVCRAWTIQAGAFDRRVNADTLTQRLQAAGLPARVVPVQAPEVLLAVQVGRFSTYAEAADELAGVRRLSDDAVITTAK